jgi:hypothetical protein
VAAIEPKLLEAEGIRSQSRSSEDLGAWEMVIHANSLFWRLTKTESLAAIATLRQVVERHPEYAPAHSMLAFSLLLARQFGWISMEPQVKQAEALAVRAAQLDDSDPWVRLRVETARRRVAHQGVAAAALLRVSCCRISGGRARGLPKFRPPSLGPEVFPVLRQTRLAPSRRGTAHPHLCWTSKRLVAVCR